MNKIISVKQIARETLPRLVDNLVFPNLIYRDASETAAAAQGDTIQIRRPVKLEASAFISDNGVSTQDITEEAVDVYMGTLATVDTAISAWENYDDEAIRRLFIEPAAAALAEKINNDGLNLYRDVYNAAGTPGTAPNSLEALAQAAYGLDIAKVPTDQRRAVWSPLAASKLKQIPAVVGAGICGDTTALRTGSIGTVFGVDNYMSQAVCRHTAGTLADMETTFTVSEDVEDESALTLSAETSIAGKTLLHGDILLIDGKTYSVTASAAASGSEVYVRVTPSLTAAAGTPVTIMKSHEANLVFHPNAFAFVTRPLAAPAGVESYVTTYNGISLRVVRGYDMKYKKEMLSMDVLYGFKTIYPELAVRYMG